MVMTDEEIEKALKDRAYEVSYGDHNAKWIIPKDKLSQETLSYIDRLKEACQLAIQSFTRMETLYKLKYNELENAKAENENMYGELISLRAYIDNHEEIWKRNAEIDKEQIRKEMAKEILQEMFDIAKTAELHDTTNVTIYDINVMAKKYGVEVDE